MDRKNAQFADVFPVLFGGPIAGSDTSRGALAAPSHPATGSDNGQVQAVMLMHFIAGNAGRKQATTELRWPMHGTTKKKLQNVYQGRPGTARIGGPADLWHGPARKILARKISARHGTENNGTEN